MKIPIYQVDAFASEPFQGNPAAVCPLEEWLPDPVMQAIAAENNLSETAFFVGDNGHYDLRWFTPTTEVDFCGHATLASAFVVLQEIEPALPAVTFQTRSGHMRVSAAEEGLVTDFPARPPSATDAPAILADCLNVQPREVMASEDLFLVFESQAEIEAIVPDFKKMEDLPLRGVIVTAPGREHDFVSRFFAPKVGIPEDPATGSAHCALGPYWSERLGKNPVVGRQLSKRGATIRCETRRDRVALVGDCYLFLKGDIDIPANL